MAPKKGVTVATTDFPLYCIRMIGDSHFLVAGGGGQAKTGVPNAFDIYELRVDGGSCVAVKVKHHQTPAGAVMNSHVSSSNNKNPFIAALGIDDRCHVMSLRSKLVTPKVEGSITEGLRKRKGNLTDSVSHNSAAKSLSFDIEETGDIKTDCGEGGGFQKAVCVTTDMSLMVTGGSDGKIRTWKFPDLTSLYTVEAHADEIDDVHLSPAGNRIISVSRDCKAYVWNTKDGSKHQQLHWNHRKDQVKYRFRSCRFAPVLDKKDTSFVYTTHIPCTRGQKPAQCYITKWDTTNYLPKKCQSTGTEVTSTFAASDNGVYLAVGTIAGSVSVYIAFSLQRLYHLGEAHSIFVTGVEFASCTEASRAVTGNQEVTVFSVSADSQVKIHQVAARQEVNVIWVLAGFLLCIYIVFWLMSTLGV